MAFGLVVRHDVGGIDEKRQRNQILHGPVHTWNPTDTQILDRE